MMPSDWTTPLKGMEVDFESMPENLTAYYARFESALDGRENNARRTKFIYQHNMVNYLDAEAGCEPCM